MISALANLKKICALPFVWLGFLEVFFEAESKKAFLQLNRWRFSRKAKSLIAVVIIVVFLISVFAFLSRDYSKSNAISQNRTNSTVTPSPTASNYGNTTSSDSKNKSSTNGNPNGVADQFGVIESATTINSSVWMKVASNAWAYYTPGVGVDPATGLPRANSNFNAFTDWDLGGYIQAVIDAQKLGLIGNDSGWSFSSRIDKVLTFLENRPLNSTTNYPFQFYYSSSGREDTSIVQESTVDLSDTGRLFVALNNLIDFNNSLAPRIDNLVLNGRSNYTALLPGVQSDILTSTSIYSYYFDSGFACFWPNLPSPSRILNNIFAAGNVTTYGDVSLPEAFITGDPLLCSVFELNNNSPQLLALSRQVYLANAAYYNAMGAYAAFSEGNSPYGYIWEWVVLPNGDTWKITSHNGDYLDEEPIIYNKVAFSFLALYNTTYARDMIVYLEQTLPYPTKGYCDGTNYGGGAIVATFNSNSNSLILDASLYAIQNNR